jgi:hypothetical protein
MKWNKLRIAQILSKPNKTEYVDWTDNNRVNYFQIKQNIKIWNRSECIYLCKLESESSSTWYNWSDYYNKHNDMFLQVETG